ncbi:tyrosine-type recombinase/integrase [Halorubrum halophilum]|uniref:tyrosine-type recombinase/integrase n=1 Tax=Halorubrum halophilum TaxID=413816 RepID=UPI00186B58A4|nr:tyrosine-type recombinase/integrase [Halorubrum halophilum]
MSQTTKAERAIEAYHQYKEKQSASTAREYRRHVRRFRDYLADYTEATLWDCHSGHAEDYYQWMKDDKGYAPSSVRVAHASLGDFYNTLETFGTDGRRGFPEVSVAQDPTEHATPERLDGMYSQSKKDKRNGDKPLSKEEVAELIENVPAPTVRNELICRMLYQTGMRRSELVRIKLDDIDRNNRHIAVFGKKTGEPRNVWYQPSLDSLLSLWIEGDRNAVFHAEDSPYLFPTRRQERMDEQTVTDVVTTAAENANLQETVYETKRPSNAKDGHKTPEVRRVGAHTLRKSFGVHFINDGGDISFLADLLGHDDIETTKENYLKYSTKDLENSVRRHGPSI